MLLGLELPALGLLFPLILLTTTGSSSSSEPGPQAAALMAIFNSTGGQQKRWARQAGWGTGGPCGGGWYGVCCRESATEAAGCRGARTSVVTGLLLGSNKLQGTLPADPAVWGSLTHIQTLNFRSNSLSGSLPPALGLLSAAVDINLRVNKFGGTLPVQLGKIHTLHHFSIWLNQVSGTVPRGMLAGLPRLGTYQHGRGGTQGSLHLYNNRMSGTIPSDISQLRGFHGNMGLCGLGSPRCAKFGGAKHCNSWLCSLPPVTWANSTASVTNTNYPTCHDRSQLARIKTDDQQPAAIPPQQPSTFAVLAAVDSIVSGGVPWQGIGGISGGGATSALLRPYPSAQRAQILDLLFNRSFAAALPILKVEIGGDAQTTDGTESSHQHTEHEAPNFERGYEWWLMKEAKRRNPEIILWGLPWAFPGWVDGTGRNDPYSNVTKTARYVVDWVDGARREHDLHISMVGCWNERPYNVDYLKELRRQLDARNLSQTGIIADDGHSSGALASAMQADHELMDAVQAFGQHYPSMSSPASATAVSKATGKPIFASEDYGVYFDSSGGKAWARLINQNFVRGGISGTIAWNLVTSYYAPHGTASYGPCPSCNDALPFRLCGLMHAAWPWAGHYTPTPQLYVSAHTTHFARVGDRYAPRGNGSGLLSHGGSFVTFVRPPSPVTSNDTTVDRTAGNFGATGSSAPDLTVVIEKMSHQGSTSAWASLPPYTTLPENLTLQLGRAYAGRELALWKSQVPTAVVAAGQDHGVPGVKEMMLKQPGPFHADGEGTISIQICVDCLFTLTTQLDAGSKGRFEATPPPAEFPLPYNDSFDGLPAGMEANFFIDQAGVWEAVPQPQQAATTAVASSGTHNTRSSAQPEDRPALGSSGDSRATDMVMRQMVEQKPVTWAQDQAPLTILGSSNWSDITVEVSVQLEPATHGMPWVGARIVGRRGDPAPAGPQVAANATRAVMIQAQEEGGGERANDFDASHLKRTSISSRGDGGESREDSEAEAAARAGVCDAKAFPVSTTRQYSGLIRGAPSLSTEAACRQACCTIGQQHCTLYQFFATEPAGSQCWYGQPGSFIKGKPPVPFVSRSKMPLPVTPPPPPPPAPTWGTTFTNAAGVVFGVDSSAAMWQLAPCHLCLHVNSTWLAHGPLPAGTLPQLAPWLAQTDDSTSNHLRTDPEVRSLPWTRLRLVLNGTAASGFIGGVRAFHGVDVSSAPSKGFAGFGMGNFTPGLFNDFAVARTA